MKVVHVIGKMKRGGVEAVVFNYLSNIDDGDVSFDVLYDADSTAPLPENLIRKGVRFIEIPPYQHLFSYISAIKKLCIENKYDIAHVHMNALSVFALFAAKLGKVKHRICHDHTTTSPKEPARNLIKNLLRPLNPIFATSLAACSEKAGRWMYGSKRFDSGKVTVFDNAIDTEKYAFSEESRESVRKELALDTCRVVGHVGRFVETKNHAFLIDAFALAHSKDSSMRLLLVGDGDTLDEMKEKAKVLGLEKEIIFAGGADNCAPYYSAFDVFALPSFYEGLPVVAVEAQASGLPCLISDTVTRECALSSKVEFLSIEERETWAEKMLTAENTCREGAEKKLRGTRFDIKHSAARLVSFYRELLCSR